MTEQWEVDRSLRGSDWVEEDIDDVASVEYVPAGMVTLRYLWDAVKRHTKIWLALAIVGLAIGALTPVVLPPAAESTTKVLLTHRFGDDPVQAIATDVELARTRTVAERVVRRLNLSWTAEELLEQYTAAQMTDRIVLIQVFADSDTEATRIASALADTFLAFRLEQVRVLQQPTVAELADANARVAVLQQRKDERAEGSAGSEKIDARLERADAKVDELRARLAEQRATVALMGGSRVLDPAEAVPRSMLKTVLLNTATGLGLGLVVGIGLIVVRALVADRVWRRQAIADALGAPITLAVPAVGPPRWWQRLPLPPSRRAQARQAAYTGRAVAQLCDRIPPRQKTRATLAVVAVSDVDAAAHVTAGAVRALATAGRRVLVADFSDDRSVARELAVDTVERDDAPVLPTDTEEIEVYLPDRAAGPMEGNLGKSHAAAVRARDHSVLGPAWERADVVLTFTDFVPARGLDQLGTWAKQAVAFVAAGRCTATRLESVGVLVRAGGTRLAAALLVGGDRTDETAGRVASTAGSDPLTLRVGALGR